MYSFNTKKAAKKYSAAQSHTVLLMSLENLLSVTVNLFRKSLFNSD